MTTLTPGLRYLEVLAIFQIPKMYQSRFMAGPSIKPVCRISRKPGLCAKNKEVTVDSNLAKVQGSSVRQRIREGGWIYYLGLYGISAAEAFVLSVLTFGKRMLQAFAGLIIEIKTLFTDGAMR